MAGNIYIIDSARVHPVDVPVTTMFKCMTKWGTGSGELLATTHAKLPGATIPKKAVDLVNWLK